LSDSQQAVFAHRKAAAEARAPRRPTIRSPSDTRREWVNLYKNYHYPILKALKEQGLIKSITLLKRDRHQLVPAWDYELQIVWRDKVAQATGGGEGLTHKLFPDWADYQKNEAHRWEITTEHWDEDLSPVPVD